MLTSLARMKRVRAGWIVALIYLLCVLAPGVALALGNPAPWLPTEIRSAAAAEMHHDPVNSSSHEHGDMHGVGHPADAGHAKHTHDGKTLPGPCCAMLCLSAIRGDLAAVAKPVQPVSVCVSENFQRLPGKAPPLLYRPPIA